MLCSAARLRSRTIRTTLIALAGSCAALACSPAFAQTTDPQRAQPVLLHWFENSWYVIEHRAPDLFVSGYNGLWLPPPSKASFGSPGYDPFDRFDLGTPGSPTTYGTENFYRAMIGELKNADQAVFIDLVVNHNGGRTSDAQFIADGGWPGFYLPGSGPDFWGDFHDGTTQSTNPSSANYNLFQGDLVGLIDIAQEKNYNYIRHPVAPNAQNIPPGNVRNRPDPNNARFYPDTALAPITFTNPGPTGDGQSWTIHPFNTANPMAGDARVENATGLLNRFAQWQLDEFKVDGFRLDAAKHIPQWFWNNYFDPIMFNRRTFPNGSKGTAFSFGESVESNSFVQTYIRRDGFGNRDALDLNEAGALRDIMNQRGFGSWSNATNASIDLTNDGLQDGDQGVHHVFSHDNGSAGSGSSAPSLPGASNYAMPQNVYVLFRTGVPMIYFNGREMHTRFTNRGFWPREGNPTALGDLDPHLQRVVKLVNGYARGFMQFRNGTDPQNTSQADVLVFERTIGVDKSNVVVAVNDRYDAGFQTRNILTDFAPGTRLRELSGTATDAVVDPTNAIHDVVVVDANRRITINIPNNTNVNNVQHHRGYVVYGPAAPSGTLRVFNIDGSGARVTPVNIPADGVDVPAWRRRNTALPIITTNTFEIRLDTTKTDPLDSAFDDFAVFKINQGYVDYNGNGSVDLQPPGATLDAGFETFLTQFSPISGPSGNNNAGIYRQVVNTALLPEGDNYVTAYAYRRRTDGGLPILTDFRLPIYVDRLPPSTTLLTTPIASSGSVEWRVIANDRTTNRVHILANVPVEANVLSLVNSSNQAYQFDRYEWRRNLGSLPPGANSITTVAYEESGNVAITRYENITITLGSGDVNRDGILSLDDLYAIQLIPENTPSGNPAYVGEADMNADNTINAFDRQILERNVIRLQQRVSPFRALETNDMKNTQR